MTMANFTQKAGYQNSLDFDPEQGIIKYGNYEKFIYQIPEIKPQKQVVNFNDWKKSYVDSLTPKVDIFGRMMPLGQQKPIPSDAELRAIFNQSFVTGGIPEPKEQSKPPANSVLEAIGRTTAAPAQGPGFRQVNKLGADTFEVNDYIIPSDVKLLYKMNELAGGTSQVTQDTALMQEQAQTKRDRVRNANSVGAGAAMLGGSQASKALAGG